MDHALPPVERAEAFRRHLIDFTDCDGLVLGEINAQGPRRFANEDFEGYETWDIAGGDWAGFISYEDSLMTTGRFIYAEVARHLAGGSDTNLALAERLGRAILADSAIGDQHESGYLPKPHGGLSRASGSRGISCDQYEHALFGMWSLRNSTLDEGLAREIDQAIVRWADFFLRHRFTYDYFGRSLSTPENAVHSLGLFLPLCSIARGLTGDRRYTDEAERHLGAVIRGPLVAGTNPSGHRHPNIVNLIVRGLVYCWRHGYYRSECERAIAVWAPKALHSLSTDGLAYVYAEGSDDNPAEPRYREAANMALGYRFMAWRSNVKGADSCKSAHTLMLAHRVFPQHGWRDKALGILRRFREVSDFRRYHDYDGRQIPREYAYMRNYLCNQFVCAWLEAYYLARHPELLARCAP